MSDLVGNPEDRFSYNEAHISFVELESPMLHPKCQDYRTSGSMKIFEGFYHMWRGSHLGHVTWTIYINLRSPSHGGPPEIRLWLAKHFQRKKDV